VPVRLAGADRVATAISVSQSSFASVGASGTHAGAVIIAVDNTYPDALAAVPLAAAAQAPILITNGTTLDPRVSAEIARVLPLGGEVYLIGGVQALAPAVAQAVESAGYVVTRLAGPDRFGTAVAVADALGDPTTVFEADGDNFADALAAGPAAAADHGVVLLTDGTNLPLATATYLAEHAPTRYAIGGPAAQADPGAIAIVGADRYATAAAVAVTFFSNPAVIGFATGVTYPDALAAGAQLGAGDSPLLLVGTNSVPASTAAYLAADSSALPMVYGGSAALSALVTQAL
jgi:putative cell wall-binding protein